MQQSRRQNEQNKGRQSEPLTIPRTESDTPDPDAVARRAYQRFEERGYEHGRDMDDWFEAERELRGSPATEGDTATEESSDRRRGGSSERSNDAA
jgi:hypothetical protein